MRDGLERWHWRELELARQCDRHRVGIDLVRQRFVVPIQEMRRGAYAGVRVLGTLVENSSRLNVIVGHLLVRRPLRSYRRPIPTATTPMSAPRRFTGTAPAP